ncbi:MAG: helix-turn-helix domain-containing protein, partial [Bacteroidetes bacterium]|nr:helix-turn-helix domain-containing protein [Bacteroidota bacterium]
MNFFSQNFEHLTTSDNFDRKTFLKATGLKETKLTGLIKGKSEPSVNQLVAISRYFGITIDELIKKPLSEKATPSETIKFLVLDVDGVMTDGGMYYSEKGDDIKKFSTKDGMGIKKLCKQGFPVGIISA